MHIEIQPGTSLEQAIQFAKSQAVGKKHSEVSFDFNGIKLYVHKDSLSLDIHTIYALECRLRQK